MSLRACVHMPAHICLSVSLRMDEDEQYSESEDSTAV